MAKQSLLKLHKFLPQHALSLFVGWLADCRCKWFKNRFIAWFIKRYGVDMAEAQQPDYRHYATFNAFFTRRLAAEQRPLAADPRALCAPVDGAISELGSLEGARILQAKGSFYSTTALLGGDTEHAAAFHAGEFLTAYLAPRDYHRVHMPLDGHLLEMLHVPGRLFSVNPASVTHIDNLFALNERVVCFFDTAVGPMAVVLVGAMLVGSIVTVWHGQVTPPTRRAVQRFDYRGKNINLARGAELGHFKMGSTVILLFPSNAIAWNESLMAGSTLKWGEMIATPL